MLREAFGGVSRVKLSHQMLSTGVSKSLTRSAWGVSSRARVSLRAWGRTRQLHERALVDQISG